MKSFLLIRHAKSSWDFPGLRDEERPLNPRGRRDAPFMASYIRNKNLIPTHLISSPAVRAFTTAQYFEKEFRSEQVSLEKETSLYFCTEEDWLFLINELDESVEFPAFFSHNPTITYFANRFTNQLIDNVPTCGIIHLESTVDKWEDVYYENTLIRNVFFPKLVR